MAHEGFGSGGVSAKAFANRVSTEQFLQQLLVFVNTFLLHNEANRLAVYLLCPDASPLVYASAGLRAALRMPPDVSSSAAQTILEGLARSATEYADITGAPALSAGLSRALCLINRVIKARPMAAGRQLAARPRILVLSHSSDTQPQYIATMNAIFAAQKQETTIDACMLGSSDSGFLQQAAHLTGGIYLRPSVQVGLLQYLLTLFIGDTYTRSFLAAPRPRGVDFRASCFCHKRAIDLGFVCSVCLSAYCSRVTECSTCGVAFPAAAGPRAPALKRRQPDLASGTGDGAAATSTQH